MADRFRTVPDWEDIRFFVALARHRTLSGTARVLGVNHATVARRVAGLEAALGANLVERRPGGYELTSTGLGVLEAASGMENAAEAVLRAPTAPALSGVLRLTAAPTLADAFLISRLSPFRALNPALDIEFVADRRSMSLPRRETDIALRFGRPKEDDLVGRKLVDVHFGFYAAPAWRDLLARGEMPVFVGFDEANATLPEALWLSSCFPNSRVAMRANSQIAQAIAARAGWGVALLPHFIVKEPGLVDVDLGTPPPSRSLWLLTRQDARFIPKIRAMKMFLVQLFRQERMLFEGPE